MRVDYYELLDAEPTATKQALRDAFRQAAKRYHPDHNADSPEAEERFKLIMEAWNTLGDEEKRADYDAWLERHKRYESMPELADMPNRQVHFSMRKAQRRREERGRGRESRAAGWRARPFLLRRSSKISGLSYVLVGLCFLSAMLPYLRHNLSVASRVVSHEYATPQNPGSKLPPGESALPPEEQKKQMELFVRQLLQEAEAGSAVAQYRYGFLLFRGVAGVPADKVAARQWWEKAAAQGYVPAQKNLSLLELRDSSPAPVLQGEPAPAAEQPSGESTELPDQPRRDHPASLPEGTANPAPDQQG